MTVALIGELAAARGFPDALKWFAREKQWINEAHLQLCRIASPTFAEQQRAQWMAQQFRALGWDTAVDIAGNVIATLAPPREGRLWTAVTAHLDTVIAPRSAEEIAVDGKGRLSGPGVSDNGAGLAALLALARCLKANPQLPEMPGLMLVANVGEEGEGNLSGMRHICKQPPLAGHVEAFLVLDGAALDHITVRALGSRRFEVTFTGPGGHSWSDHGMGNPVHALSRAVAAFTENSLNGGPKASFNVGVIEGGTRVNAIPASARAKIDIRSEVNDRMQELVTLLTGAVERSQELENQRSTGGKVAARIREIGSRPAAALAEDADLLRHVRAVDAHLGIRARLDTSSTDANIPLSMGIPALSIGAGGHGGGAHTLQEWYSPEGRDLGLRRILLTLASQLAVPE